MPEGQLWLNGQLAGVHIDGDHQSKIAIEFFMLVAGSTAIGVLGCVPSPTEPAMNVENCHTQIVSESCS